MRKYILLSILILLIPVYLYATDGVSTVEHPAKVNSVTTPDKVCGVSGLAAAGTTDYTADANCMGAWFMNGGASGNGDDETDRSGEGGTLTETSGDIPNDATVPAGYSGSSRDFERGDSEDLEHADGGSTDISGANQALSIVAWVKFESDTNAMHICSKTTTDNIQWKFYYDSFDDFLYFTLSDDGSATTTCKGVTDVAGDGNWHHVAAVYNDTDMRIYVDGSLDGNGNNPESYTDGIFDGTSGVWVGNGATAGGSLGMDGLIDELAIFDRELSAVEVSDIMTNGIDGTKGAND